VRLPGVDNAVIEPRKIRDYLLSTSHAQGRTKASFFSRLGYSRGQWHVLASDLRRLAEAKEAMPGHSSEYGTKYEVRGRIAGPVAEAQVVTIWIILRNEDFPRFVTAYPE
jgi:hypothetical protein